MNRASAVKGLKAWEALDSRGRPTVAARLELVDGSTAAVAVPSGASAGRHEAVELRDGGIRFGGRGVSRAVHQVRTVLTEAVTGVDVCSEGVIDSRLREADPSPGFATIGANAVLAVSLAAECAAAVHHRVSLARWLRPTGALPLPLPMVNIVSGGAHARGVIDIQDVLMVPVGAESFAQAVEWAAAVRESTAEVARQRGLGPVGLVADEGGLGLALPTNRSAVELVADGVQTAGLALGDEVGLAVDVAASEFFVDGRYCWSSEDRTSSSAEMVDQMLSWVAELPLLSVEDPFAEDDWDAWRDFTHAVVDHDRHGSGNEHRTQVLGDDLLVTDLDRLQRAAELDAANAVLVKVNQNGLVSGARAVHDRAHTLGWNTVVSARSGETGDSWLADLAVGWGADQFKVGSTHRGERTAKWNRMLELEATEDTVFAPGHGGLDRTEDQDR